MAFTCATYEESSGWRRLLIVGADDRVNGGMLEVSRRNCDIAPRDPPPTDLTTYSRPPGATARSAIGVTPDTLSDCHCDHGALASHLNRVAAVGRCDRT